MGTDSDIDAALAAGDPARAAALALAALAAGRRTPLLLGLAGWARETAGDLAGAEARWREALALDPADPMTLTALGAVLRKRGVLSEAMPLLDAAVAAAPKSAPAWLERGFTAHAGGALEDAAESYHTAARLDPGSAPALAGFAAVAVLLGYPVAARDFGGRALAIDPHDAVAAIAVASVDDEAGDHAAAAARLRALVARAGVSPQNRIAALTLLGNALGKLGQATDAFTAFAAANRAFTAAHAPHFGPGSGVPPHQSVIERTLAAVAAAPPGAFAAPARDAAAPVRTHAFLLGYPRSGTTLVENILATVPGVAALEERPTLHPAEQRFLADDAGLAALARLDVATAQGLQHDYWHRVVAMGVEASATAFVDMDPFHTLRLPLIARLFPGARLVVMRRDPRDVVWSCFRTSFAPSPAFYALADLETAARHYDATMRLLDRCITDLPLAFHVVDYARLVADFDAETQRLCGFLDLQWSPELRRFDRTAQARGVSTASVGQVRRGLFDGGGQWRPYAAQLAGVRPLLDPWAKKFGYPP